MQQELIGRGSTQLLTEYLSGLTTSKLLLVTGKASYHDCGAKQAFDALLAGYDSFYFDDFSPNPKFEEVMAGVKISRRENIDLIIAVGGGSAIDVAKCIAAFHRSPGLELQLAKGESKLEVDPLPIIAVPTTAGTGSEATHFAVIYVEGKKYSLASQSLLPAVAVLDSVYSEDLPPYITASTGFDALCQAVESYWSVGSTSESRGYAIEAISLLLNYLPTAVNAPEESSREEVLYASHLAGKAINISKTTAPHALSYTITSLYGVPHGHAAALTLGAFFTYHDPLKGLEMNGDLSSEQFQSRMKDLFDLMGVITHAEAKIFWYDLMQTCGLDLKLGDNTVALSAELGKIVASVNLERLKNHPVKFSEAQLLELLKTIT
jgi:alcohol dehydrogenase class IV